MRTIHIFGNPDLPFDALPIKLMPRFQDAFPNIRFRFTDPNELDLPEPGDDFTAIDTVDGLKDVREISIDEIAAFKARATAHDYDLASYLLLVQKIQKNIGIHIIGIPMHFDEETAFEKTKVLLTLLAA
jgi:hypothetical protein